MRVAVLGPSGMLGKWVCKELGEAAVPVYARMFNLVSPIAVKELIENNRPLDGIINCIGVIPIKSTRTSELIQINTVFPHILCELVNDIPIILISTDCVFSGRSHRPYTVNDIPDPKDYYGRSKVLGEVAAQNASVVRTSFIGCEHGFMNWILSTGLAAKSTCTTQNIEGWKNALWTGSTVQAVAKALINMLDNGPRGLIHLATEQVISKYDLAQRIIDTYSLNVTLKPEYNPILNRALRPTVVLESLNSAMESYRCLQDVAV